MSEFDVLYQKYAYLEREINKLKNNTAPTIPSQDSTNFPQDAVHGQIVKDINDHSVWVFGEDDTWHKVGGGGGGYAAASMDYPYQITIFHGPGSTDFTWQHYSTTSDGSMEWTDNHTLKLNADFNHGGFYLAFMSGQFILGGGAYSDLAIRIWQGTFEGEVPSASWGGASPLDTEYVGAQPSNEVFGCYYMGVGEQNSIVARATNIGSVDHFTNYFAFSCVYIPVSDPLFSIIKNA